MPIADRKSVSMTKSYRSNTLRVLCPLIIIAVSSGMPARTRFRTAVRRKSCSSFPGTRPAHRPPQPGKIDAVLKPFTSSSHDEYSTGGMRHVARIAASISSPRSKTTSSVRSAGRFPIARDVAAIGNNHDRRARTGPSTNAGYTAPGLRRDSDTIRIA